MVWSVMSDPLGLSIGTTNLVAARVGNQPVIRRSVLTLADGTLLTGFVERIGDSVPLVAPDGSTHHADRLLVDALGAILQASGGQPVPEIAIAVPAYWGMTTLRTLRTALRANPDLAANGTPARLLSDAVASLTALHANLGLPSRGVVALLDFGGGGTSITLTDAGAAFEPIDESIRFTEFSGDQIDQALLSHIVDRIAATGGIDPSGTAAVGSLARLREECRRAKERLSVDAETEVAAELPGYRAAIRVARTELESLIAAPLDGALAALENALKRNGIGWPNVAAVVTVGGGASIPLIAQRLSGHSSAPVVTTPQPAFDAAVGAALFAAYGSAAEAQTGMAPAAEAQTGMAPARPGWRRWRRSTRRDRRLSARWPGRRTTTSRTNPSRTPARTRMTPMPFRCVNPCSTCPQPVRSRSLARGSGCRGWCSGWRRRWR